MHNMRETGTNPAAQKPGTKASLYYYRARYYDPSVGRFISEDPMRPDDVFDFYVYARNEPTNVTDPRGLYGTDPAVPKPLPPRLDEFMKCLDRETGTQQYVTATTNDDHTDPGHAGGTSLDLRPVGTPSKKLFCAAGKCGAKFVLDERALKTKKGSRFHYHIQLELLMIPNAPNSIPDTPDCKPSGCKK
ncbi:MAG TPA: RHS repeat-associated core domain-containing protein [Candidatus Acidoferrum sp.]|nr:RHS repeat-associated core domain-containing protein [Candidatus Acidoferrum sp.]